MCGSRKTPEWGQHEGVLVDPGGNTIRFASPMNAN
jgi:hypothetical protein